MKKKILVFEGIDGCGKTSVINEMKRMLEEQHSVKCEILNTPHMIGNIRDILKTSNAEKYNATAYKELLTDIMFVDKISSAMPGGLLYEKVMDSDTEVLLLDRFLYSFFVYNFYPDCIKNFLSKIRVVMEPIYVAADYYNIYLRLDSDVATRMINERGEEREVTESNEQSDLVKHFDSLFDYEDFMPLYKKCYSHHSYNFGYTTDILYSQYQNNIRDTPSDIANNLLAYIFNYK